MVVRMHGILHHEPSRPRHRHAVARNARRENAVEHIDPVPYPREEVVRRADPHEIAWLVGGKQPHRIGEDLLHQLVRLTDTQASDGIARQIQRRHLGGVPCTQVAVHTALHNAKKALSLCIRHCVTAAQEPPLRALRGCLGIGVVGRIRNTLVERHDNIRAETLLYLHRYLGRQKLLRAVDVRAECRPLLRDLAEIAKTEHLKAAAVREDCAVPVHEPMQPARLAHELHAGAEKEMIGIAEDDTRTEIAQLIGRYALDRRLRAHGHEDGRRKAAVLRVNHARARARCLVPAN